MDGHLCGTERWEGLSKPGADGKATWNEIKGRTADSQGADLATLLPAPQQQSNYVSNDTRT